MTVRRFVVLGVLATLMLSACQRNEPPVPLSEQMIHTAGGAELAAARAQAVKTLPIFWSKFYAKEPGVTDLAVKVELAVPGGGGEYIWGEPVRQVSNEIVVKLLNDAERLPGLKFGSEVHAPLSAIWDWTYTKGGQAYGHFTTRVLMKEATAEQRAQAEGVFAPTPLETKAQ